ncbi:thioredoxin-like protein [Peziza echinospora]|nr:thioredoxin-like protein [Peziza echinospora]
MQRTMAMMFKLPKIFQMSKTPDILTLFHSPSSPVSVSILNYLKETSKPATPDSPPRFELDVITAPTLPTPSQYISIIDFLGGEAHAKSVLSGVDNSDEGARKLADQAAAEKSTAISLHRPILVDWNNGRVVLGGDINEVKTLVNTLPQ